MGGTKRDRTDRRGVYKLQDSARGGVQRNEDRGKGLGLILALSCLVLGCLGPDFACACLPGRY